jgi:tRNA threonylcarbamoyladenosine biosynthesis protein TsaB
LDIVAYNQPQREEPMLVVLQAGRGRVAGMWYKWGSTGWAGLNRPENLTWEEILDNLEETTYVCGEISSKGRALLKDEPLVLIAPPAFSVRRPAVLADLGLQKIRSGMVDDPSVLAPIYLPPRSSQAAI